MIRDPTTNSATPTAPAAAPYGAQLSCLMPLPPISTLRATYPQHDLRGVKRAAIRADESAVASSQSVLLECLAATERAAGSEDRWVTARAVARRLGPTADPERIGRDLTRLQRVGLVELWFEGGASYYRVAR